MFENLKNSKQRTENACVYKWSKKKARTCELAVNINIQQPFFFDVCWQSLLEEC
jgi:hypothetical protein